MIVVILAAGMGQRLRPLTKNKPKLLLKINGKTLLERFISVFNKNNISEFIFVVGHCKEKVDEAIISLQKKYNINMKIVENEKYEVTNTSCSTYLASKDITEDFILINGDNILDSNIIRKIINTENTGVVIDNCKELNEESFKITTNNGIIEDIGKELNIETSNGEFIGVSKVVKRDIYEFNEILCNLIKENPQNYYDFAYKDLSKLTKIDFIHTNGLKWTEIDDYDDWKKAKEIVKELDNN